MPNCVAIHTGSWRKAILATETAALEGGCDHAESAIRFSQIEVGDALASSFRDEAAEFFEAVSQARCAAEDALHLANSFVAGSLTT